MKYILGIIFTLLLSMTSINAQNICVITDGEGRTKREATLNALQTALEETYGTFISSKSVMKNYKITSDEIVSLCQGSICSFREVSYFDDSVKSIILDVNVSLDRYVSYINNCNHGNVVKINGAAFANTQYLKEFNRQNVKKILGHLLDKLNEIGKDMYDYDINTSEPFYAKRQVTMNVNIKCTPNNRLIEFKQTLEHTWEELHPYVSDADPWVINQFNQMVENIYKWSCYDFSLADNIGNHIIIVKQKNVMDVCPHVVFCESIIGKAGIYMISDGITINRLSMRTPFMTYNKESHTGYITFQVNYDISTFEKLEAIYINPTV